MPIGGKQATSNGKGKAKSTKEIDASYNIPEHETKELVFSGDEGEDDEDEDDEEVSLLFRFVGVTSTSVFASINVTQSIDVG